jgi:hypothetical protein
MAAKKKRPRGRPKLPKGEERAVVLTLRLRESERRAVQNAADRADRPLSEWARAVLLERADLG